MGWEQEAQLQGGEQGLVREGPQIRSWTRGRRAAEWLDWAAAVAVAEAGRILRASCPSHPRASGTPGAGSDRGHCQLFTQTLLAATYRALGPPETSVTWEGLETHLSKGVPLERCV